MKLTQYVTSIINIEKRPLIFACIFSTIFLLLAASLELSNDSYFVAITLVGFIVLIGELYITSNYYYYNKYKKYLTDTTFGDHSVVQMLHHVLLPSLLYLSAVMFLFFNKQPSQYVLVILISLLLFYFLFENIYSFYKYRFTLRKSNNYIYDIITGVFIFFASNSLAQATIRYSFSDRTIIIVFLAISGISIFMLTLRNSITKKEIFIASIFTAILTTIFTILLSFTTLPIFLITFITSILYFTYNIFINFYIEKLISKDDFIDFTLIIVLAFTLLQFAYR